MNPRRRRAMVAIIRRAEWAQVVERTGSALSQIVSRVSYLENCLSVIRLDEIFGLRALTRVDVCVHDSKSQRNRGDSG